jgi:HK97 family phage major capsid protein
MNLTEKLKSWLTENQLVPDAASDEDCKSVVLEALQDGKLTPQKLAEMTAEDEPEDELGKIIGEAVGRAVAPLAERMESIESASAAKEAADLGDRIETATRAEPRRASAKAAEMFQSAADQAGQPRVKAAVEQYDSTKSAAFHAEDSRSLPGQPARLGDRPLDHPSRRDLAIISAWFKSMVNASGRDIPRQWRMTDHDKQLVEWAYHNETFSGDVGRSDEVLGTKLSDLQRKTLLDEAGGSQGEAAVPDVFDDAVLLTPVLHGEVFPLVNVVPIARGSAVDGFSLGNPTIAFTAEGGAITEFNTAAMIAGFDTTIFPAVGAITLGLDFASDSPVDIGALLVRLYGERFMEWLDNQICNGDGTTEPQGVLLAGSERGTDMGNPADGDGAAPLIDDYETLMFTVGKEWQPRQDWERCAFISNLTSYRRARGIAVGGGDTRRVFGMDHRGYRILDAPFKIQNNIANNLCGYYNFRYYRMYRRLGMQVRVETAGSTLALNNEQLIVVRQRWGGQFENNSAGAYSDNWQGV